MEHQFEIVDRRAQPTLVVRRRASATRLPEVLGPAWGAVMTCAGKSGATPSEPPFAAFHNTDQDDLDVEIGFSFDRPLQGEGEVSASEVPAGRTVQGLHVGPFDRIGETYGSLQAWLSRHGLEHDGPAFEHYLDDPADTPADQLRTRVVVPVR